MNLARHLLMCLTTVSMRCRHKPQILLVVVLPLSGCVDPAPEASDRPYPPSRFERTHVIDFREWTMADGTEYRDRNDDGVVDWQAQGSDRYTDGFGLYKEDNDFDGYYEREYVGGGYAYHVTHTKAIHEPVPPIHSRYRPTKFYWKPVGEAPVTGGFDDRPKGP